jgi:hypothetical protein
MPFQSSEKPVRGSGRSWSIIRFVLIAVVIACGGLLICWFADPDFRAEVSSIIGLEAAEKRSPPAESDRYPTREDEARKGRSGDAEAESPRASVTAEALREGAFEGKREPVRTALEQGIDVNAVDEGGRTALMLAAFNGHSAVARMLLEHGAQVNLQDAGGRTALMYASTGPYAKTVELLLEHEAEVNLQDSGEHWTALMFAAGEGHADVVELLLSHGANPKYKDIDGETAADFARSRGHDDVVKLLQIGPQ